MAQPSISGESSLRSPAAWARLLIALALALTVDLWSKHWAFETVAGRPVALHREQIVDNFDFRLPFHDGIRVLPADLLDFRLVLNHGAVFGIGDGARLIFIGFTIVAALAGSGLAGRSTR
ncbi:MAG: signal peptidase II [Phycisphaerales bacterium]